MEHVVVSKPHICPRCGKKNIGAAVSVLDFLICPDCFYDGYQKELEPVIKKMVIEYFQPERLNPED